MKKIAIFASGSGTNAQNICQYFEGHPDIQVALIVSNKPKAFVLERAQKLNVPTLVINREGFYQSDKVIQELQELGIDWIVLAGFLWLVPVSLIQVFEDRIINVHPALLPKYGGKGMYGMHVHKAVCEAQESETGITIHLVNQEYDKGRILAQMRCPISPKDSPKDIASKVHQLEYAYFPKVIEISVLQDGAT